MSNWNKITIFLFLFSLSIFLLSISPEVYFGDSAEFSTTIHLLDIGHPPSYPVYHLLGKLFCYIPAGNIAFRTNLYSAYFSAFTTIFIFLTIFYLPLRLEKTSQIIAGIFSGVIFSFSYTFWEHSIKSEVYTLYIFLFTLIFFSLIFLEQKKDIRFFYLAIFFFSISLANHLLILLSLTSFLYFIIGYEYKILNKKNIFITSFFILLFGFSSYLYLPLRSAKTPEINWGRPASFEGFKYIILLKEQGKILQEVAEEKIIKKEEKEIKKEIRKGHTKGLTFTFLTLFLIFSPVYFGVLSVLKRDYRLSKNWILFIFSFPSLIFFTFVLLHYLQCPPHLRRIFFSTLSIKDLSDIIYLFLFSIFFSLSFKNRHRKIAKNLIIVLSIIVSILAYTYFLKFTKGYKAGDFPTSIYLEILIKQFTIYLFPLGILGLFKLYRINLRVFAFLYFLFLSSGPLPIILIIPDNLPYLQERFSLPAYLVFSIFIGFGVIGVVDFLKKYIRLKNKYFYPLLLFSFLPLSLNFKEVNKRNYYLTKYYVEDIFFTLPENSLILAKGINTAFPLWYFNFVERKRPDVKIVFIDALTQRWYVENLRETTNLTIDNLEKKVKSESERRTLYIENIIKNNIDKYPIYYGGAPLFVPAGIKEGEVLPEGILFKIIKEKRFNLTEEEIKRNEYFLNKYKFLKPISKTDYYSKDVFSIYAGGYFKLAFHLLSGNREKEAIKYLNKSLKIDKKFIPSYEMLLQIYLKKNDIETAEKILKEGIKNNPNNIELLFSLANLYFDTERVEDSLIILNKIIRLNPEFIPAYFKKAEIYFRLGEKDISRKILKNILKIHPDNQPAKEILKQLELIP